MIKRMCTGAGIVALLCGWLYFSYIPALFYAGVMAFGIAASVELLRISEIKSRPLMLGAMAAGLLLLSIPIPYYEYWMALILPTALLLFAAMTRKIGDSAGLCGSMTFACGLAVILLLKALPCLREREGELRTPAFAIAACLICDIAAYLCGKVFGSHRLCPVISPGKTVEGAIGGMLATPAAVVCVAVLLDRCRLLRFDPIALLVWAFLISIVGQLGDLCLSVVKRVAGVKDFGRLLPGHGGVLDRFDSQLFGVAFTLVYCALGFEFVFPA